MIHRPEIGQNPHGSKGTSQKQGRQTLFADSDRSAGPQQDDHRHNSSDNIPEKGLLHGRDVSGQPHKDRHSGKEKSRQKDEDNPFSFILYSVYAFLFFACCPVFTHLPILVLCLFTNSHIKGRAWYSPAFKSHYKNELYSIKSALSNLIISTLSTYHHKRCSQSRRNCCFTTKISQAHRFRKSHGF